MESGLEDRNNELADFGLAQNTSDVSMESGLEDRNNAVDWRIASDVIIPRLNGVRPRRPEQYGGECNHTLGQRASQWSPA